MQLHSPGDVHLMKGARATIAADRVGSRCVAAGVTRQLLVDTAPPPVWVMTRWLVVATLAARR